MLWHPALITDIDWQAYAYQVRPPDQAGQEWIKHTDLAQRFGWPSGHVRVLLEQGCIPGIQRERSRWGPLWWVWHEDYENLLPDAQTAGF
jgi:hypothetical protein